MRWIDENVDLILGQEGDIVGLLSYTMSILITCAPSQT